MGGLVTFASPNSSPEGASPRCNDVDYIIGDVLTRPHEVSYYSFGTSATTNPGSVAVNTPILGIPWLEPTGILANDSQAAYIGAAAGNSIYPGSDGLTVTGFAFDIPATSAVTGIAVTLTGYATTAATVYVQLSFNGVVSGTTHKAQIGPQTSTLTFGGPTDGWANAVGPTQANAATFGIRIVVESIFPLASVLLNYATISIYQTSQATNFDGIATFRAEDGTIRNVALDAFGNLWVENATANPGVLTLLETGLTSNSYLIGVNNENAEFMAISALTQGADVPRLYSSQGWVDRISQVGPGAAPVFAAQTTTGTTPANITSWSASGGIVTFQASNNFTAGEVITLSQFPKTIAFNGSPLNVLGTGLSTTQFEVAFRGVTGSATESGLATPQYTYPIVASPNGITQLPQRVRSFAGILWSSAPGTTTPGTTITFYYSDSTIDVADAQLVNLFNSGVAVYVFISGSPAGNGTWQVTSVGIGTQPQEARQDYYFTIQVPQTEYANYRGQSGYGLTYQITAATLTTLVPVPNLTSGQQFTISAAGVSSWNNLWTVSQALNSSVMAITETTMVAGIATYSFALTGGSTAPPAVGELVTVSNTLNGGGIFNVIDVPIIGVSGVNNGTFTVGGFPTGDNYAAQIEAGQAQTAGTQFNFDPGQAVAGTQSSPIYGNSGGGVVSLASSAGQVISPGTKQGVVFFITRNGYETAPSPPVQFTVPINSNYIEATLIPVGPPNVIARAIGFTESGSNGQPGGNFFTIPTQVQFVVNGVQYTSSALIINDNVTTSARFTFSDAVLLSATAIDVEGNNLFNLIEIGNPGWMLKYADRMVYGLCQNKLQNFLNLSFDGGYIPGTAPTPLGWNADPLYGSGATLLKSPIFGNSYYVLNSTAGAQAALGMISQSAYQDFYQAPVIAINNTYSVRVTCRCPSNQSVGTLVVDLTDSNLGTGYGTTYGTFALSINAMSTEMVTYTGTLLTTAFQTVPTGLLLRVWAKGLAVNADVEVDRVEVYPTAIPVLNTQAFVSYANNYESVDAVTGVLGSAQNQQPMNNGQVMDGILYLLKNSTWYETQDTPNTEPAYWDTAREVSQVAGACGPLATDSAEGWIVSASKNGLYCFTGGQPGKINQEIYQIWDAINWAAGQTIWTRVDTAERKIYVGVPLPTPNFWLPNAPANAAPTTPNVILMCNYQGIDAGEELKQGNQVHATMFGNLMAPDMRRKWSIWQIACPVAEFINTSNLGTQFMLCNGVASSKIYTLEPNVEGVVPTDDGAPINSLYTTYQWNSSQKVRGNPLMGNGRIRWGYLTTDVRGTGNLEVRLLPNALLGPNDSTAGYYPFVVPGGIPLVDPSPNDRELTLNFPAYRTWLELSTSGYFEMSSITMTGRKDTWNSVRGIK